jgi:transposase
MNKLQYWTYSRTLNRIQNITEQRGINLVKVSPAYTSQQCSHCGAIDKNNRQGEAFLCTACGYEDDADLNASLNILQRGAYSPSSTKNQPIEIFQ